MRTYLYTYTCVYIHACIHMYLYIGECAHLCINAGHQYVSFSFITIFVTVDILFSLLAVVEIVLVAVVVVV